jgi:radical SAM protein with 4Fe4S-binding SPASM domain
MNTEKQFIKSKYLVKIKDDRTDKTLVYHSLFNNPRVLDSALISFVDFFENPTTKNQLLGTFDGDIEGVFQQLLDLKFITEAHTDERDLIKLLHKPFIDEVKQGSMLERLELAISDACNLGCSHCMHFKNNQIATRTSPVLNMSIETAKKSIDTFLEEVAKTGNNKVRVHFGNGEPLLNWKTMKFCLEYCSSIPNIKCSFATNTNLTILSKEIAETLKKYRVKIATSLDGLKEGNDAIRVDLKGRGTFDKIIEKINYLREIDYPIEGFTITVTSDNFDYINTDIIDFAKSIGVKDISMDCDLVDTTNITVERFVRKIVEMRGYANLQGMNFYGTWETPYRAIMAESWLRNPHAFCPAMEGRTLSFGVDGTIKTCGHTNTKVGNVDNITKLFVNDSSFVTLINDRLPGNNEMCKGCVIEGSCAGQCHVTVESSKRNGDLIEEMCDFMRLSTKELLRDYLVQNE